MGVDEAAPHESTAPQDEIPPTSKWRRRFRRIAWIVLGCAALWLLMDLVEILRLRSTVRALQARGEPLELTALAPPPVADEDNAAILLADAFAVETAVWRKRWLEHARAFRAGQTTANFPPQQRAHRAFLGGKDSPVDAYWKWQADLQAVLQEHAPTFVVADAALERSECRFDLAYEDGVDLQLPHLSGLRGLARLYTLRAVDRAATGDTEGALADCGAILRLAQTLEGEPILVSHLVRIAIDGMAIDAFEAVVTIAAPPPGVLDAIAHDLADEAEQLDYDLVLRGERAVLYAEMQRLGDPLGAGFPNAEFPNVLRAISVITPWVPRVWQRIVLTATTEHIDAVALPYAQARDRMDAINAGIQYDNSILHLRQQVRRGPPANYMPAIGFAFDSHLRSVATLRMAAIRFQIEADLIRGGTPPTTLDAFDRPLRTDPFANADFRVRREDEALLIYSIGLNTQDDGGVYEQYNRDRSPGIKDDFVMRVPLRGRVLQ